MADSTGGNFDQHFGPLGGINLDLFDDERRIAFVKDGSFHGLVLLIQ
jgi:hypothetical protein